MPLPNTRDETLLAGITPVKAALLNNIQDWIINHETRVANIEALKHGDKTLILSPTLWVMRSGTGGLSWVPPQFIGTSAGAISMALPLIVGDRIKSVAFMRNGDGAVDLTAYTVYKLASNMSAEADLGGSGSVNNVAAAWNQTTVDVADTVIAAGESCRLELAYNATGFKAGHVALTFDHP
jgi:hypothetical protein